jgi:hypothetical protein
MSDGTDSSAIDGASPIFLPLSSDRMWERVLEFLWDSCLACRLSSRMPLWK